MSIFKSESRKLNLWNAYGRGFNATDEYSAALFSLMRVNRIYDPDYANIIDPDPYTVAMRDAVFAHAAETRTKMIIGTEWRVEPSDLHENDKNKFYSELIAEAFTYIKNFNNARRNLSLASIKGRTYGLVKGEKRFVKLNGITREWWIPTEIEDLDKRRFAYFNKPGESFVLHINNKETGLWEEIPKKDLKYYIQCVNNTEEQRLKYGFSLLESCLDTLWLKDNITQMGMEGFEAWIRGVVIASPSELTEGNTEDTNERIVQEWTRTLKNFRKGFDIIKGKEDQVELLRSDPGAQNTVLQWRQHLDADVVRLLTGSLLPTGAGADLGSLARAEIESDQALMYVQSDREMIDESLTNYLVQLFIIKNWSILKPLNLADTRPPKFVSGKQRIVDPKEKLEMAKMIQELGLTVEIDEVYDGTPFSVPRQHVEHFSANGDKKWLITNRESPLYNQVISDSIRTYLQRDLNVLSGKDFKKI